MKITFVTMQLGRSYVQGTERYVETLGQCLKSRGHAVDYLAGDPLGQAGCGLRIADCGLRIAECGLRNAECGMRNADCGSRIADCGFMGQLVDAKRQIFNYPTRGWMTVVGERPKRLEFWLRKHRADVVHLANPAHIGVGIMDTCRRLGIPVVITTMDFWWICPRATLLHFDGSICDGTPAWPECVKCMTADHVRPGVRRMGRLPAPLSPVTLLLYFIRAAARGMSLVDMLRWPRRRAILARYIKAAEQIIFPSRAACEAIKPLLSHDRWRIVPYGLPARWFDHPRPGEKRIKNAEELTVGYAGALLPHKGPHLLIEAIRLLGWERTKVRIAGPPADAAYYRKLQTASVGLNVDFTGQISGEHMPDFLRSLDVLAMTSVWPENLPFIVLEAQAAGVPVVAGNLAGVAGQIGNRRMLFEPGSVQELASALRYVRENPENARPGKVYTIDQMTDATEAVYHEAIARSESK